MIKDEYTNSKSNNSDFIKPNEYSEVQSSEYSGFGNTHLSKTTYDPSLTKKMQEANNSASNVNTVSTASTATSIAATSTTAIVVASTVAITAISVATGISVALHDYQYHFNSFIVTSNQLIYDLQLDDLKLMDENGEYDYQRYEDQYEEESNTFLLRVYNQNYDVSQYVWLGYNEGLFSNLNLGEKYNIVLSENRYGGEVLFSESFTTVLNSIFVDFYFPGVADYYNHTAEIYLNYIDELDVLEDFVLTLSREIRGVEYSVDVPIAKTNGYQTITMMDTTGQYVDLQEQYHYAFSYHKNQEKIIYREGEISFYNTNNVYSAFNDFIFDGTANYINNTFDVQLDFIDGYDIYTDFNLNLSFGDESTNGFEADIPLEKTVAVQTINCETYDINVRNQQTWHYKLTCYVDGELTLLAEDDFIFNDNSNAVVQFNELIFDKKANFDTREITLQLDYIDDLYDLYNFEFVLSDLDTGNDKTIYLDETLDPQTFAIDDIDASSEDYLLDVTADRMTYSFSYYNNGQLVNAVTQSEEFYFENSLVSTFQGITTNYDFTIDTGSTDYLLPIKFNFDDAAHDYEMFMVDFYKNDVKFASLDFEDENVVDHWLYGYLLMEDSHDELEVINAGDIDIIVSAVLKETPLRPAVEEIEVYSETASFTSEEQTAIYDAYLTSDTIVFGSYEVSLLPVYVGETSDLECQIIFETQNSSTYTCTARLPNKGSVFTSL